LVEQIAGHEGHDAGPPSAVALHRGPGPFPHTVRIRGHELSTDELFAYGGRDSGPDPTELLAAALASCTSMTLRVYAERKGWALDGMAVRVAFSEDGGDGRSAYTVTVELPDDLDEGQAIRLASIATKCPVRRALSTGAGMTEAIRRPHPTADRRAPDHAS